MTKDDKSMKYRGKRFGIRYRTLDFLHESLKEEQQFCDAW
jgi:hypothetical protein